MISNMTIYWMAYNGNINGPITADNTLRKSLQVGWDDFQGYLSYQPQWVTDIQKNALNSINQCFQNYANITVGLGCAMTSNKDIGYQKNEAPIPDFIPYSFKTRSSEVAKALTPCLPLLDTYCMMSYGVSISNTNLPFNTTFNMTDNMVSLNVCQNMQEIYHKTDSTSEMIRLQILLKIYNSIAVNCAKLS